MPESKDTENKKTWQEERTQLLLDKIGEGWSIIGYSKDNSQVLLKRDGEGISFGSREGSDPALIKMSINIQNTVSKVQLQSRAMPTKQYTGGITKTVTLQVLGPGDFEESGISKIVTLFQNELESAAQNRIQRKQGGIEVIHPLIQAFDMNKFTRASFGIDKSDVSTTAASISLFPLDKREKKAKLVKSTKSMEDMYEQLLAELIKRVDGTKIVQTVNSAMENGKYYSVIYEAGTALAGAASQEKTVSPYHKNATKISDSQAQPITSSDDKERVVVNRIQSVILSSFTKETMGAGPLSTIVYNRFPGLGSHVDPRYTQRKEDSLSATRAEEYSHTLVEKRAQIIALLRDDDNKVAPLEPEQRAQCQAELTAINNYIAESTSTQNRVWGYAKELAAKATGATANEIGATVATWGLGIPLEADLIAILEGSIQSLYSVSDPNVYKDIIEGHKNSLIGDLSPVYSWLQLPAYFPLAAQSDTATPMANALNPDFMWWSSGLNGGDLGFTLSSEGENTVRQLEEEMGKYIIDQSSIPGLTSSEMNNIVAQMKKAQAQ